MDRLYLLPEELSRTSSICSGNRRVKGRIFVVRHLALGCVVISALILLYMLVNHAPQKTPLDIAQVPGWTVNTSRNLSYYIYPGNNTSILSPGEICKSPPYLLVVICSAVRNLKARMALRDTWANTNNLDALYGGGTVRVVFLLGQSDNNTFNDCIVDESLQYNDIIQEKFLDTYNNLTLKSAMMLKWVTANCQQAKYLMKTDDDMFVNIPTLLSTLRSRAQVAGTLIGFLFDNSPRISDPQSKWYAPGYMFSGRVYPDFLSGTGYVMSLDVVSKLYDAALAVPLIHLEDVYITGICAKYAKVRPINHPGFSPVPRKLDMCVLKDAITAHEVNSSVMYTIWTKLKDTNVPNYSNPCRVVNKKTLLLLSLVLLLLLLSLLLLLLFKARLTRLISMYYSYFQ